MSKPPKKLEGRPAFDDRGNATWEWAAKDPTEITMGRLKGRLLRDCRLEALPEQSSPDPYNQALLEGTEKTKRRSLDDMRLLSEKIKRKREHEQLVKSLCNDARVDDSGPVRGMRLRLLIDDRELVVDERRLSITMGRAEDNDVVVKAQRASRQHARIEISRDKLVLVDVSANGTFIQTEDREVLFVSRDSLQFEGQGTFGFGHVPMPEALRTQSASSAKSGLTRVAAGATGRRPRFIACVQVADLIASDPPRSLRRKIVVARGSRQGKLLSHESNVVLPDTISCTPFFLCMSSRASTAWRTAASVGTLHAR